MIDNTDTRTEIGNVTADGSGWADFADVADRLVTVWHVEAARAVQVLPLRLVLAVAVEHLVAVVFAVGDIDLAFRGEGRVGAAVKRLAAHIGRRLAWHTELQQHLAVQRDLAHEMAAI